MNIFESLELLPVSEECFIDIMNLVEEYMKEEWSGTSKSKWNYEDPEKQEEYGYTSKRVEMSPDEYIKKCARQYKRRGYPQKTRTLEKSLVTGREEHTRDDGTSVIDNYAKEIKDPNTKVDEPFLFYHHRGNIAKDQQDGLHRAIAAKKAGLDKIPVHIFHPNQKKTKAEQREALEDKKEIKKRIGEVRADNKKLADKGSKYIYSV